MCTDAAHQGSRGERKESDAPDTKRTKRAGVLPGKTCRADRPADSIRK